MGSMRAQGWYYLIGGLWPLLHFPSFEAVAGPKPDRFQTEVTSVLFVAVGAGLLSGPAREERAGPAQVLAITSAAGVAWLDCRHRRVLRPLFRVEAALEAAFAAAAACDLSRVRDGRRWWRPAQGCRRR
jgi:hypothetical protein